LLVTQLQHARTAQQRARRVRWLRADTEPVECALHFDVQPTLALARVVLSDHFDELPVTRTLRVGDDETIHRCLLPPNTAETNANHAATPGLCVGTASRAPRVAGISGSRPGLMGFGLSAFGSGVGCGFDQRTTNPVAPIPHPLQSITQPSPIPYHPSPQPS